MSSPEGINIFCVLARSTSCSSSLATWLPAIGCHQHHWLWFTHLRVHPEFSEKAPVSSSVPSLYCRYRLPERARNKNLKVGKLLGSQGCISAHFLSQYAVLAHLLHFPPWVPTFCALPLVERRLLYPGVAIASLSASSQLYNNPASLQFQTSKNTPDNHSWNHGPQIGCPDF